MCCKEEYACSSCSQNPTALLTHFGQVLPSNLNLFSVSRKGWVRQLRSGSSPPVKLCLALCVPTNQTTGHGIHVARREFSLYTDLDVGGQNINCFFNAMPLVTNVQTGHSSFSLKVLETACVSRTYVWLGLSQRALVQSLLDSPPVKPFLHLPLHFPFPWEG